MSMNFSRLMSTTVVSMTAAVLLNPFAGTIKIIAVNYLFIGTFTL